MEDACREYQSSLEDLTFNSKPHINMLTILAEENLSFAKDIVAIIEAQISKAPPEQKLPVLYLVDSIVKNVGGEYLEVFAKNLIASFICVFEKVDENTRKSLFKLRSTWDDVFPLKKLYALDVRVNSLDPAWPIKPLPPTVNASIHVNPKFLKQSDETVPSPQPAPSQPPPAAAPGLPASISQSSLNQEQLIRQQLLAKQKQLLELQQKKIELELEQTKAQLAGAFVLPPMTPPPPKPVSQPVPMVRPWIPTQTQADPKPPTRDPRLNRGAAPPPPPKQESQTPAGSQTIAPEKPARLDKARTARREDDKPKAKSLSPMAKGVQNRPRPVEAEPQKTTDGPKKDPRLKKRPQEKNGDPKDDELKKRKEREEGPPPRGTEPQRAKGKLVNGAVTKHDRDEAANKVDLKTGGNARTHARKRSRSRSPSPKRKERRSPKKRPRSSSPSPTQRTTKPRRDGKDRPPLKNQSESRRPKRVGEERHLDTRDSHPPRGHEGGAKETPHRWRSGWEDNKRLKLSEDPTHMKPGSQGYKPYGTPTRPGTPRTPKHRLSVDANLQIPEVLNSASKKDLLRRASKRVESGEISHEDFLNMAHKIKNFFQYQEERQQLSKSWDDSGNKTPLPPGGQPRPLKEMNAAQLSYYEHKSKLKKTQVNHRSAAEEWEGVESPEEGDVQDQMGGERKYSRPLQERPDERRSKERDDPRPPLAPMIEEYNHGKEFPTLKSMPELRFRRRADPRESSDREWNSPLTERQHYDDHDEQKSGYDTPRRYGPPADPRRAEGPPSMVQRNCPSPVGLDRAVPVFERERLSPLQKDPVEMSPVPRFESPNSEHSDDGPLNQDVPQPQPQPQPHPPPKSILKATPHGGPMASVRQHTESPGHTPPHDPQRPPYNGPTHMGPSRPRPQGWYDDPGHYDDAPFEGPPHPGPVRFEGGPPQDGPGQCEGPQMAPGPMRGSDSLGRFDGPPQGQGRFGGPMGQQPPVRFEGQGPGPGPMEGPMQRFEAPRHFNNMGPGPGPGPGPMGFQQQRPMHFEGPPNQMGPMRFDSPGQQGPPRYDMPHQDGPPRFDFPPRQQGPPRFTPQLNLQPPMRPMGPLMYDGPVAPQQNCPMAPQQNFPMAPQQNFPMAPQQNFPMAPQQNFPVAPQQNFPVAPQRFPEPINPQFPGGPMAFPSQPTMQQGPNFNMQPGPPFSQPGPGPFYNPATPALGLQQPGNLMGNMNQPFLPHNPVPFTPQNPPMAPPENHFGQVDVNDLLSKLISTGIIKPSQPDTATSPCGNESTSTAALAAPVEEEEEEEQEQEVEEEDLPDLTSFNVDDMKQRYDSVVTRLYSGNQCCLCSMRFTAAQTDLYSDHLDWHFRQNHAGKVASRKVTHRRWYYSLTDWIEFEEIADLEERAKSRYFEEENEKEVEKNQEAAKEKEFQRVRAAKDQVGELCEICQESFETYWVEEEEDWFLKNAMRVDDKNFHPSCFEDYKNTSSYLDVTPSPSKLLTENPLSAFIKSEEEEITPSSSCEATTASSCSSSVKQEELKEEGGL
ncbi:pre-mRNA cleavage complex 2 protein Pcf11-like [Pholidichthys leucotaenia]